MSNELKITADELFVLGELMDAEYIDYSYIKLMSDIQANYAMIKADGMESLSAAGALREGFSGVRIAAAVKAALEPVFFGTKESVLTVEDISGVRKTNFHIHGDQITCVEAEGRDLNIRAITEDEIRKEYLSPLKNTAGISVNISAAEVAVGSFEKKWDEFGDDFEDEAMKILKGEKNGI